MMNQGLVLNNNIYLIKPLKPVNRDFGILPQKPMKGGFNVLTLLLFGFLGDPAHKIITKPDFPKIDSLVPVACDFHLHTYFSDGIASPEERVREAIEEGIDAISLTEHIEDGFHIFRTSPDLNRSYDRAVIKAKNSDLIIIRGGEISRDMPPGHHNALFLSDVNGLKKESYTEAFCSAKEQKAFIFWNHPAWRRQAPNGAKWYPEHDFLVQHGYMHGIEVVNEGTYCPSAHRWCIERNLTMMATSDLHGYSASRWDRTKGEHRPLTVVYARERTAIGIKDALLENKTLLWHRDSIIGSEEMLTAFFSSAVRQELVFYNATGVVLLKLQNLTGLTFNIRALASMSLDCLEKQKIKILEPHSSVVFFLKPTILQVYYYPQVEVANLVPEPGKVLRFSKKVTITHQGIPPATADLIDSYSDEMNKL